jgi:hypothetical protein
MFVVMLLFFSASEYSMGCSFFRDWELLGIGVLCGHWAYLQWYCMVVCDCTIIIPTVKHFTYDAIRYPSLSMVEREKINDVRRTYYKVYTYAYLRVHTYSYSVGIRYGIFSHHFFQIKDRPISFNDHSKDPHETTKFKIQHVHHHK